MATSRTRPPSDRELDQTFAKLADQIRAQLEVFVDPSKTSAGGKSVVFGKIGGSRNQTAGRTFSSRSAHVQHHFPKPQLYRCSNTDRNQHHRLSKALNAWLDKFYHDVFSEDERAIWAYTEEFNLPSSTTASQLYRAKEATVEANRNSVKSLRNAHAAALLLGLIDVDVPLLDRFKKPPHLGPLRPLPSGFVLRVRHLKLQARTNALSGFEFGGTCGTTTGAMFAPQTRSGSCTTSRGMNNFYNKAIVCGRHQNLLPDNFLLFDNKNSSSSTRVHYLEHLLHETRDKFSKTADERRKLMRKIEVLQEDNRRLRTKMVTKVNSAASLENTTTAVVANAKQETQFHLNRVEAHSGNKENLETTFDEVLSHLEPNWNHANDNNNTRAGPLSSVRRNSTRVLEYDDPGTRTIYGKNMGNTSTATKPNFSALSHDHHKFSVEQGDEQIQLQTLTDFSTGEIIRKNNANSQQLLRDENCSRDEQTSAMLTAHDFQLQSRFAENERILETEAEFVRSRGLRGMPVPKADLVDGTDSSCENSKIEVEAEQKVDHDSPEKIETYLNGKLPECLLNETMTTTSGVQPGSSSFYSGVEHTTGQPAIMLGATFTSAATGTSSSTTGVDRLALSTTIGAGNMETYLNGRLPDVLLLSNANNKQAAAAPAASQHRREQLHDDIVNTEEQIVSSPKNKPVRTAEDKFASYLTKFTMETTELLKR
ncbi:unnamed protein product [Amoebophrya sp. A120]|nr:unnamed protein product [Amoebophrya sp. A120]|eukprot:GSA120T00013217001.1